MRFLALSNLSLLKKSNRKAKSVLMLSTTSSSSGNKGMQENAEMEAVLGAAAFSSDTLSEGSPKDHFGESARTFEGMALAAGG